MGEWADDYIDYLLNEKVYYKVKRQRQAQGATKDMLIQGKAKWTKVLGEPVWGYENKFKEWSIDVYVDDATEAKLKAEGLGSKLKDKGNGTYITFKRKELKVDGTPNQPIRVVDHHGEAWGTQKIGNGSVVNVNFAINEFGKGKDDRTANILSMQVWDLVKFEGGEFPTRDDTKGEDWAAEVESEAAE